MGVYCNKITRRARRISGRKVHTYTFAYRSGGSMFNEYPKGRSHDEHMHFKYVRPTAKAWEDSGDNIKDALFVADYEDGAEVYRAYGVSFYDTGPGGEHIGHLRMEGSNGKLRIEFLEPVLWEVTFKGAAIHTGPNKGGTLPDRTVNVVAINPERAKRAASEKLSSDVNVPAMSWTSMYPKIEKIDLRTRAGEIVGKHGVYLGEGVGYSYRVGYNGTSFYANCTSELADKLADYMQGSAS